MHTVRGRHFWPIYHLLQTSWIERLHRIDLSIVIIALCLHYQGLISAIEGAATVRLNWITGIEGFGMAGLHLFVIALLIARQILKLILVVFAHLTDIMYQRQLSVF